MMQNQPGTGQTGATQSGYTRPQVTSAKQMHTGLKTKFIEAIAAHDKLTHELTTLQLTGAAQPLSTSHPGLAQLLERQRADLERIQTELKDNLNSATVSRYQDLTTNRMIYASASDVYHTAGVEVERAEKALARTLKTHEEQLQNFMNANQAQLSSVAATVTDKRKAATKEINTKAREGMDYVAAYAAEEATTLLREETTRQLHEHAKFARNPLSGKGFGGRWLTAEDAAWRTWFYSTHIDGDKSGLSVSENGARQFDQLSKITKWYTAMEAHIDGNKITFAQNKENGLWDLMKKALFPGTPSADAQLAEAATTHWLNTLKGPWDNRNFYTTGEPHIQRACARAMVKAGIDPRKIEFKDGYKPDQKFMDDMVREYTAGVARAQARVNSAVSDRVPLFAEDPQALNLGGQVQPPVTSNPNLAAPPQPIVVQAPLVPPVGGPNQSGGGHI